MGRGGGGRLMGAVGLRTHPGAAGGVHEPGNEPTQFAAQWGNADSGDRGFPGGLEKAMLQGSFDTFDLAEVLGILARKNQTGRLRLHSGSTVVDLFLHDGRLVRGETTGNGSSTRVADNATRLEEACMQVLRWDHGTFEFQGGSAPGTSPGLDAEVEEVLAGAQRRLEEWERVMSVVPSLDVVPRMAARIEPPEVSVDRDSWRLLAALDGRRNGHALCRALGMTPYEVSRILSDLVGQGLVDMGASPRVAIAPRMAGPAGDAGPVRVPKSRSGPEPEAPAGGSDDRSTAATGKAPDADTSGDGAGEDGAAGNGKVRAGSLMRVSSRLRIRPANG